MDTEEKRKKLQNDILDIIEEKVKIGEMSAERAKAIAKMLYTKLYPTMSIEELYAIAPSLDDEYTELSRAVLPFLEEHDEKLRKGVTKQAEKLIHSGKLEEADTLIKQTIGKI